MKPPEKNSAGPWFNPFVAGLIAATKGQPYRNVFRPQTSEWIGWELGYVAGQELVAEKSGKSFPCVSR